MVYVAFWVGVPCASLLAGDVWRLLSPWRAIGRAVGAIAGRGGRSLPRGAPLSRAARPHSGRRRPGGLRDLRAVLGAAREPATLAVLMLVYTVVMLVGMSLYGVEPWSAQRRRVRRLLRPVRRLAPIARHDGVLYARPPIVGATGLATPRGDDRADPVRDRHHRVRRGERGPAVQRPVPSLQDAFTGLGFAPPVALELGFTAGLLGVIGLVALLWRAGHRRDATARPSAQLAHALIPILAAYVVAHYFSLLAYNGQDLARLASDPLGDGSDLFGGAGATIDYGVVSATAIWYVQVPALVVGHVAALVLAHDRALVLYASHREATRSQVVMLRA